MLKKPGDTRDFMEYRDVHDTKEQLNYFLKQIDKCSMSSIQKKNILKFVEELKLGKAGQVKVKDRRIKKLSDVLD